MAIEGRLKVNVQILHEGTPAIGPGKALVLDAIARTGSISAAGRDLGMSYRRIWLLVDSLNGSWDGPLVAARGGGGKAAGAQLTPLGCQVLDRYRAVERRMVAAAVGPDYDFLVAALKPSSHG